MALEAEVRKRFKALGEDAGSAAPRFLVHPPQLRAQVVGPPLDLHRTHLCLASLLRRTDQFGVHLFPFPPGVLQLALQLPGDRNALKSLALRVMHYFSHQHVAYASSSAQY